MSTKNHTSFTFLCLFCPDIFRINRLVLPAVSSPASSWGQESRVLPSASLAFFIGGCLFYKCYCIYF